jgi:hypothetical protein
MRELVVVADSDVRVTRDRSMSPSGERTFDLRDPRTCHAVCFRPSAMHLRDAGLPSVFDRVEGSRDDRIDMPVPRI